MNKKKIYFLIIVITVLFSCKRYGNDPLTLRTPLNRITGTWEMTKYEIDGVDSLGLVNLPYEKMIFSSKRSKKRHLLFAYGKNDVLTWKFDDKKQKIEVSFTLFPFYGNDSLLTLTSPWNSMKEKYYYKQWDINKLTNKEMILSNESKLPDTITRSFVLHMRKVSTKTKNDF